jgi:Type II secretion system (T2SS), protein E, N-terminal domain
MLLGERLVQEGLASQRAVDQALAAQVIYGGRLGTNLVEARAVRIDELARALGRHLLAPVPEPTAFDSVSVDALRLVSRAQCERLRVVPFALDGDTLHVAMTNPHDGDVLGELTTSTRHRILQYVVPEFRLFYCLERYYGVPRGVRYARANPSLQIAQAQAHAQARRERPEMITSGEFAAIQMTEEIAAVLAGATAPVPQAPARPADAERRVYPLATPAGGIAAALPRPQTLTGTQAHVAIEAATGRDAIAVALIAHALASHAGALLLVPRDGVLFGWRGWAKGLTLDALETLWIPLDTPSLIADAAAQRVALRGGADTRVHQALGWPLPGEAYAFPIVLGDRMLNLLYVFPEVGVVVDDAALGPLYQLCHEAAAAWARLLLQAKRR